MRMNREEMKKRTKQFALAVIQFVESLPRGQIADVLGRQLLRSGTSGGVTTVQPVEANPLLILLQRWELWKKKRMNASIG
jgi:hypothetical protein